MPEVLFINLMPDLLDPGRVNSAALNIFITPLFFIILNFKVTTNW